MPMNHEVPMSRKQATAAIRLAARALGPQPARIGLAFFTLVTTSAGLGEGATPQALFDSFRDTCQRMQSPAIRYESVDGVRLDGVSAVSYLETDGPEGSMWGFVFDLPVADFKARFPALADPKTMPVPDDLSAWISSLTRSAEQAPSSDQALLACIATVANPSDPSEVSQR